jgi:hypothetical protein
MVPRDPVLDLLLELPGLLEDPRSLGVADDVRGVMVESVPLPPARLEVDDQSRDARADGQLRGREAHLVMALFRDDPSGRARRVHQRRREDGSTSPGKQGGQEILFTHTA